MDDHILSAHKDNSANVNGYAVSTFESRLAASGSRSLRSFCDGSRGVARLILVVDGSTGRPRQYEAQLLIWSGSA